MNPFWENYYRNVEGAVTANYVDIRPTVYAIQQYEQREDPRLSQLYVSVNNTYQGVLFGDPVVNHDLYGTNVCSL